MFERFTDRARRVLVLAQDEARDLDHNFLGTEHILLGLLHEGEGVGAKALVELGLGLGAVRDRVTATIGRGEPGSASGNPPFTPRAKRVLELALREALEMGHNYIGTEHQLLALLREGEGVAAQVLVASGLTPEVTRAKVIELLAGFAPAAGAARRAALLAASSASGPTTAVAIHARAIAAAGSGPLGSHHYLLSLLGDPDCLAARILASLGVTADAVASRVTEMGTAGTSDEQPPLVVPPLKVQLGAGVALEIDDPDLVGPIGAQVAQGPAELTAVIREALTRWLEAPPATEEGNAAGA